MDAYGTHSLACNRSAAAGRQLRHHLINDIICRSLARANIHSSREPLGLYRSDGKRPDIVTLTPWRAGKCLIWDATSPDTQAASHIKGTSQKAGAAAEQAAILKADKYRELTFKYFFHSSCRGDTRSNQRRRCELSLRIRPKNRTVIVRETRDCAYFRKNFNRSPAWKCGFVCGVLRGTGAAETMISSKNELTI